MQPARPRSPKGTNLMSTLPDHLAHLTSLTIGDINVAKDILADVEVSTVYIPAGKHAGQYTTEVFADNGPNADWDGWRCFYPTRERAELGHAAIVAALAEGRDLDTAVQR